MEMLSKKEPGTAKVIIVEISFVRYPIWKKVMAYCNEAALIHSAKTFERYPWVPFEEGVKARSPWERKKATQRQ